MTMLNDGRYEVIVVDAHEVSDGVIVIELAVSSGEHRGDVVTVRATNLRQRETDLLAAPGTLVVDHGEPTFSLD